MTEPRATKKGLSPEVFEAIRRIEVISDSLTKQALTYWRTATDNGFLNRPLLAKEILRSIDDIQKAGEAFRLVAEIAE